MIKCDKAVLKHLLAFAGLKISLAEMSRQWYRKSLQVSQYKGGGMNECNLHPGSDKADLAK